MASTKEADPTQHEDWLVFRAKACLKNDPYAAKSWLITARTLYPRHFGIQFEAYNMEKVQRNTSEAAKQLEDMFATFGQERELWEEVRALSESLQSTATDEHTEFLRAVFGALPATLQCHLLQQIVDGTADVLEQCRLALLILRRYPDRGPEQGVKLMDSLLTAEKQTHLLSPVNCYRKYMVCDMLPLVLKTGVKDVPQKLVLRWLQKTIEFYICYSAQADPEDSQVTPDMMSPSKKLSFSASGGRRVAIAGLPESDAYVEQPWQHLFETVHLLAKPLAWDMENLLNKTSVELQLQRLQSLQQQLSSQTEGNGGHKQFLYCSTLLFFHSLHKYMLALDPEHITGPGTSKQLPLVLTEGVKNIITTNHEPRAKRHKTDQTTPSIHASPRVAHSKTLIQHFTTALRCSDLINSTENVKKEFVKLCQHWKTDSWPWLRNFETDMLIYKGQFKEAMSQLQKAQALATAPTSQLRCNLQLASCHYNTGSFAKCCEILLDVIMSLPPAGESALVEVRAGLRGRQLQLLTCSETEIVPYCVHLLITCFKEKAFRGNSPDDTVMGHMIVLLQYDWPRYEPLFAEVVSKIRRVGSFTYSIFFNYVVCIDMLEEFSYLRRPEGGKVTLDVLTVSTKTMAQQRTVTRGVNKGVKEDFKVSMEKQVARSGENIDTLIRQFLSEQRDSLQTDLL